MKPLRHLLCLVSIAAIAGLCGCDQVIRTKPKDPEKSADNAPKRKAGAYSTSGKKKQPAPPRDAEKQAESEAIEFHNNLYAVLNVANKPLEKILKEINGAVSDAHRNSNADRSRWRSLHNSEIRGNFAKIPDYDLAPPDAFSSDDKEFFNARITTVRDSVREIIAIINDLEKYYAAEDYKDDWFKKVYMAAPRMEALAAAIRDTSEPLGERIDEITDEIDARNVAKIPVGQWVLNMRGFMKKYRAMSACLLRDEFADPTHGTGVTEEQRQTRIANAAKWVDKAEALCAELDELAAEQRALTIADYEGSRYEKIYQRFYAKYDDSKTVTRRVMRNLRERGTNHDQHSIKSDQRDISRQLGEFTKLWNEKGSGGK